MTSYHFFLPTKNEYQNEFCWWVKAVQLNGLIAFDQFSFWCLQTRESCLLQLIYCHCKNIYARVDVVVVFLAMLHTSEHYRTFVGFIDHAVTFIFELQSGWFSSTVSTQRDFNLTIIDVAGCEPNWLICG